ncbi:MAG: DUF521 domain-containing protein, partial [Chloroflexi bacterium]|nr:DUF521 domain-containing protein [Chloroflexota bacterium]
VKAHTELGCASAMTCTPYWAGHWPTWNMHMTSIESGVTVSCNSVLGAHTNRDGFFSVYAALTGRYPRFGYHLDRNRVGTHRVKVAAALNGTTDFSCLGFHIGKIVGTQVPVFDGFSRRPTLDELDALGAGLATTGGVSMFIVPGITPPFDSIESAFAGSASRQELVVKQADIDAVYGMFETTSRGGAVDFVHLGCPHASLEEMKDYARLLGGRKAAPTVDFWITTSRAVPAAGAVGRDQEGARQPRARSRDPVAPLPGHRVRLRDDEDLDRRARHAPRARGAGARGCAAERARGAHARPDGLAEGRAPARGQPPRLRARAGVRDTYRHPRGR